MRPNLKNPRVRIAASAALLPLLYSFSGVTAQEVPWWEEPAKPLEQASPHGVSYLNGGYNLSIPVISIGNGEWPSQLQLTFTYDSSSDRDPHSDWTHNLRMRWHGYHVNDLGPEDPPHLQEFVENFVLGNTAFSFYKKGLDPEDGPYEPLTLQGHSLAYDSSSQTWAIKSSGGDVYSNLNGASNALTGVNYADGNAVNKENIANGTLFQNANGLGIVIQHVDFYTTLYCTYNLTKFNISALDGCSHSQSIATVRKERQHGGSLFGDAKITSIELPNGGTYRFEYSYFYDVAGECRGTCTGPIGRWHLTCVKLPGQNVCAVRNEYETCDGHDWVYAGNHAGDTVYAMRDEDWTGSRDRVVRQTLADGRIIDYSYQPTDLPCFEITQVTVSEAGQSEVYDVRHVKGDNYVEAYRDELNRSIMTTWTGGGNVPIDVRRNGLLETVVLPNGVVNEYEYDARGNRTASILRTADAASELRQTAGFEVGCLNPKTCNKPIWARDAKGQQTDFEWSADHGMILKRTLPADDNGVRPETRYSYVQKYAWILKAGGGFEQASSPVWVLASEEYCRTSAADANGDCAAGAADEVVTTYEYQEGSATKGSNIWLVGTAVTADGQTLRSCFSYDKWGRRVSETSPRADLASCQ